ncbi:MAG: bifunctional riboflavin kinase/FAD synthetase [Flavobacteriales bacterium]
MKLHSGTYEFSSIKPTAITIGTFDGVHKGHVEIIHHLKSCSQLRNLETVVLTFHPHPRTIVRTGDHGLELLTTMEERKTQKAALGVDHLVIQPFTEEFSRLTPFEFVRDILVRDLNADTVIIGHDHRFGRNREGNFQTLMELSETFGFKVQEIPAQLTDGIRVSSSKIRQALADGKMDQVENFLGREYSFTGEVVTGDGRGRSIGFPTMNLKCHEDKMLPGIGVYAVTAKLNEMNYRGVMNIGVRPTVKLDDSIHVEVHLPEFVGNAYGYWVHIEIGFKIRDEKRFDSVVELTQAIKKDIEAALA